MQSINLGSFDTEAEAALAYDLIRIQQVGADANTNFCLLLYAQELEHRDEVRLTHTRFSCVKLVIITSVVLVLDPTKMQSAWHGEGGVGGELPGDC